MFKKESERLYRRRNLIFGVMILSAMFGLSVSALRNDVYLAHVALIPAANGQDFWSAVQAVPALPLLEQVAAEINLSAVPEFNRTLSDDDTVIAHLRQKFWLLFPSAGIPPGTMVSHLRIAPDPQGRGAMIAFFSRNPDIARRSASEIAEAYAIRLPAYRVSLHSDDGLPPRIRSPSSFVLSLSMMLGFLGGYALAMLTDLTAISQRRFSCA